MELSKNKNFLVDDDCVPFFFFVRFYVPPKKEEHLRKSSGYHCEDAFSTIQI